MLQVRENEISLRIWSGGAAYLRALEGTLVGPNLLALRNPCAGLCQAGCKASCNNRDAK